MNPFYFSLEIAIVIALLYFLILIIDSIWQAGTGKTKLWFRREIGDDFPYPAECWDCNRTDCVDCYVLEREEK